jgi:hypothetical protein
MQVAAVASQRSPASHSVQAAPASPQCESAGISQLPSSEQQPCGHESALHRHTPRRHSWPDAQLVHGLPFAPHAASVVPLRVRPASSRQPLGAGAPPSPALPSSEGSPPSPAVSAAARPPMPALPAAPPAGGLPDEPGLPLCPLGPAHVRVAEQSSNFELHADAAAAPVMPSMIAKRILVRAIFVLPSGVGKETPLAQLVTEIRAHPPIRQRHRHSRRRPRQCPAPRECQW